MHVYAMRDDLAWFVRALLGSRDASEPWSAAFWRTSRFTRRLRLAGQCARGPPWGSHQAAGQGQRHPVVGISQRFAVRGIVWVTERC
jgi:hypothetical protein